MRIDLTEIRNVLGAADKILSQHDGEDVHNSSVSAGVKVIRLTGAPAASLADDLRVVQDYLRLADAEISALVWMSQGREDPRRASRQRYGAIPPVRGSNGICGTSPGSRPAALTR